MNKTLAEAIINEAKDRGLMPMATYSDDEATARKIIANAKKAYDKGVKNDDVMIFINMEKNFTPESPESTDKPTKEQRHSFMEEVIASTQKGSIAKRENLPEPPEIEGSPPDLPGDITQKSDLEVRQLHSEFFASFARAGYLLSIKENESENAKAIMDFYEDREVSKIEKTEKKMTATAMKALAREMQPLISEWRAKWLSARAEARELRGLKEIYDKACDRLSREMSMREREQGNNGD